MGGMPYSSAFMKSSSIMPASSSPLARSSHLLEEALLLVDRVIELGESVAHLAAADEQLETLGQARILGRTLCQRRNVDRVHRL